MSKYLTCFAVASVVSAIGCSRPANLPQIKSGIQLAQVCPADARADMHYEYPSGNAERTVSFEFHRKILGEFLRKSDTPPLWCGPGDDAIRFIYLTEFRPAVVVTLRSRESRWTIVGNLYADPRQHPVATRDQFEPDRLDRTATHVLDPQQVQSVRQAVENTELWQSQATQHESGGDLSPWVIELRQGTSYRAILRSGSADEKFRDFARFLVELSGIPLPDDMARRRQAS